MTTSMRPRPGKVSVAVIMDGVVKRESLAAMLSKRGEFTVIATGVECSARTIGATTPAVVVSDARLLEGNHAALAHALAGTAGGAKIIATGVPNDHAGLVELARAGICGFVAMDATIAELADTIRSVACGATVVPPRLAKALFQGVAEDHARRAVVRSSMLEKMTSREREITLLIAKGKSNKEIAVDTYTSTHTVKSHVRNIMKKLAVHSRLQIAARANSEHVSRAGNGHGHASACLSTSTV